VCSRSPGGAGCSCLPISSLLRSHPPSQIHLIASCVSFSYSSSLATSWMASSSPCSPFEWRGTPCRTSLADCQSCSSWTASFQRRFLLRNSSSNCRIRCCRRCFILLRSGPSIDLHLAAGGTSPGAPVSSTTPTVHLARHRNRLSSCFSSSSFCRVCSSYFVCSSGRLVNYNVLYSLQSNLSSVSLRPADSPYYREFTGLGLIACRSCSSLPS